MSCFSLSPFALAAKMTVTLLFSWPLVFSARDFASLSVTVVLEIIWCHTAVSFIAIMQSKSQLFLCFNWWTYKIYDITLSIICSGVFCHWVVRRRGNNPFYDINFSSHPSLARKSFICPLLAAFSSVYILAFL